MKVSLFVVLSGLFATASLLVVGWFASAPSSRANLVMPGLTAWNRAIAEAAPDVAPAMVPNPTTATPADVRRFVGRLTAAQRATLIRLAPAAVGNLDGMPITMRYAANELTMAAASPGTPATAASRFAVSRAATSRPASARSQSVQFSRAIAAGGTGPDRTDQGRPPGRTLAYDPRGDGRVVQVLGDLGAAEHIVVLVPGSSWRLDNTLRWPPGSRVTPLENAAVLASELGPSAAVVVWLGYDTPERVDLAAIGSARAVPGAVALRRFLAGLPAAHTTLLCHSYGTVVCGRAVAAGAKVDDLVAIASPGLDVNRARKLPSAARVWAARTPDDPIQVTPPVRIFGLGHGTAPIDPAFGARVFRVGAARGHDGYLTPGTESLANIVRIVLGRPAEVTLR